MTKPAPRKVRKNNGLQKQSVSNVTNGQTSTKESVNAEHPINGVKHISTWVCKNLTCKAVIPSGDSFCKRCSCCICHKFDDSNDQSLWFFCASENDGKNCCGSICHIECLLRDNRVGCFDIEKIIYLDGSFSCAACGKISGILGYLKRQLVIGKDARRVGNLCHQIHLIYRLLEGSRRFKELYEIIENSKEKLESEVGPLNGMSAKMAHGIVSRSSVGIDVQKLCSIALQKADNWLSTPNRHLRDSLPAACRFRFVDIKYNSFTVILIETSSSDTIKCYKLWYWKSRDKRSTKEPVIVPKDERKIVCFNLSPCTEYSFRVVSFTDDGILGHSESRCFTGSKEIYIKRAAQNTEAGASRMEPRDRNEFSKSEGFKIRNILKINQAVQLGNSDQELLLGAFRQLRFNPTSATAPMDLDYATEKQHYHSKRGLARSNDTCCCSECRTTCCWTCKKGLVRSKDSETGADGPNAEPPAVGQNDASATNHEKEISGTRQLGEDYEYCIKVIRELECNGHIQSEFRKKFMSWFSLRSTDQERKAVSTFIETLGEEPSSLADQLVDCFGETVTCKKPKDCLCNKLQH